MIRRLLCFLGWHKWHNDKCERCGESYYFGEDWF